MMDTITPTLVANGVAQCIATALNGDGASCVHTVTIELNGAHGGADVHVRGFTTKEFSFGPLSETYERTFQVK